LVLQCFLIGHRDAPEELMSFLETSIEQHILEYGVSVFLVGSHGHFDTMAAKAVIKAKERYGWLQLYQLLAYHPAERSSVLPKGFDGSYYPEDLQSVPRRFAISRANRIAIDESDYIISYAIYPGGAKTAVNYAIRRKGSNFVTLLPHP